MHSRGEPLLITLKSGYDVMLLNAKTNKNLNYLFLATSEHLYE